MSAPPRDRLRVLIGHRPPGPVARYVDQVVADNHADGRPDIDFQFFGGMLKRLDVDVVHLFDPIRALGPRKTGEQRLAQAIELVRTLDEHRIALVQTVFRPGPGVEDSSHEVLDEQTAAFIALDPATRTPDPELTTVIPHVHYRDRFLGFPRSDQVPGRLLTVARTGLARAAEGPLKVFSVTDTPGISLRVVGDVDPALGDLVARARGRNPDTVSARIAHLSDAELVTEISAAELVILPSIDSLHDQTMLFMALSLDRPVVVPQSATTDCLAEQVGPGWVHCVSGPLTAELLDDTIDVARRTPHAPRPNLDGRDGETVARLYAEVFRGAADRVRLAGLSALAG